MRLTGKLFGLALLLALLAACGVLLPLVGVEHVRLADVLQGLRITFQLPARSLGQCVARQIVGRWAQPAGGYHDIGPIDRPAKNVHTRLQFVTHRGMIQHPNAQFFQSPAEPR